jgi:uracil-DNA glycosylase
MKIEINNDWKNHLKDELNKDYFSNICKYIDKEIKEGKIIYPNVENIFSAFNLTTFNSIKVVIIGQDPYHNPLQAHGLSFSVKKDVKIPPSLKNIFKELNSDINISPTNGDLSSWAEQGVFLLNGSLTVEENKPMSHSKIGWEIFTNNVIKYLSENKENLVFILWGKYAETKQYFIDETKHFIIKSAHPSPLSAYNGFFGSKPFSKTNDFLKSKNINQINWNL